jgi:TRAP-type C4-dicarboxylate transport system substrate-binding protein
MNSHKFAVLLVAMIVIATAPSRGAAQERKIVLKVGDYRPATHSISVNVTKYWMDEVVRATNGAVQFEYYPAQQLGTTKDLLVLTQSGAADIGDVSASYNTDKLPLSEAAMLPGSFATSCEGSIAYWKLAKDGILAKNEYSPIGLRVLFAHVLVPYQIYMGKKFEKLSDLEGRKLRSSGATADIIIQRLGAVPIKMPAPEVHESFSRGTVDGLVFPLMALSEWKLTDIVKTATAGENFGSFVVQFAISERRWATLPASVQKAMRDAGEATVRHGCEAADNANAANLEALKKSGAAIMTFSPADREEIKRRMAPVAQIWAEGMDRRGKPGSEVLKAFRAAVLQSR